LRRFAEGAEEHGIPFTTALEIERGPARPGARWELIPQHFRLKWRRAGNGLVRTFTWDEFRRGEWEAPEHSASIYDQEAADQETARRREARDAKRGAGYYRENSDGGFGPAPTLGHVLLSDPREPPNETTTEQ